MPKRLPRKAETGQPENALGEGGSPARGHACASGVGDCPLTIWTIGHSTRTIEEFIGLLRDHGIETLVDVRHFPGSRRFPHFNQSQLRDALAAAGIRYVHLVELGGRRPPRPDSHNLAWRNAAFRGYADYMETPGFRAGIDRLLGVARASRAAIMCSEAVWWRCHRSMIADYLKAMGVRVFHILQSERAQEHPYTAAAQVTDGLSYEAAPAQAAEHETHPKEAKPMTRKGSPSAKTKAFKVGDHVEWNSEAGRVRGTIKKKLTSKTKFKTYTVHASMEEPQYLIKSDKTDHLAMHRGSALKKIKKRRDRE
jgi:hypothetical protein